MKPSPPEDWTGAHLISAKTTEAQRRSEAARLSSACAKLKGKGKPLPERRREHSIVVGMALYGRTKWDRTA